MTDSLGGEGPDPDGWMIEKGRESVESTIELPHKTRAESDRFQAYMTEKETVESEEPLYSASTIQAEHEQARKQVHERIREFQDEHRDVPYPVKDIVDEAFDRLKEVFQDR